MLKVTDSLFKHFFVFNESCQFLIWIFTSELFQHLQSLSQIIILILKLEYFSILLID